jgi:GGDEF domain-containing protein
VSGSKKEGESSVERKARILIIEDDPDYQEIIGRLCEEAASELDVKGAAISVASNLEKAQRLLQNSVKRGQPFDLVTIDINLRDRRVAPVKQRGTVEEHKEGLNFLENLKASCPETCALIVSAEVWRTGEYRHIIEALDKHASAFLEKHKLDREEFKRIVQGTLYYAEAIEHKNAKWFGSAARKWGKAKELAPKLNFPVNVGDILQAVMQNPVTGLPSGKLITDQLRLLLPQEKKDWAVLNVRIDHLADFYDYYGVTAGDAALYFTADTLKGAMGQSGATGDFLGHTLQNDFIVITSVDKVEAIREQSVTMFAEQMGKLYHFREHDRGYIEVEDKAGEKKQVPLMSLEMGIVTADDGPFSDTAELATRIAQA